MRIPGYEIHRTIGKGGMATVYLAQQESLRRQVALKTLRLEEEPDDEATDIDDDVSRTERFLQESRIIASLSHSHIVQIYDIGATEQALYFSMEYMAGGDLQSRVGAPLPPEYTLDIVLKVAAALEVAHRKGIVHRDVKPANILFREDGTPLLSDFGIAKELDSNIELTSTGRVLGSPFYLSPEQAESFDLDGRTDLYSLGVILYEMLTGARPYEGGSAVKIVIQHLQSPVPTLPAPVAMMQPLLDRMMAKDREQRFATAKEVMGHVIELRNKLQSGSREGLGASARIRLDRGITAGRGVAPEVVKGFKSGILEDLAADRLVLPSLPDVVLSVRRELERAGATGSSISRVIATDPALSAQLLRVANSAFYFGQAPVRDLQRAVVRLGSNVVHQVVNMLVVAQLYDVGARPRLKPYLMQLWQHSTLVAALSEAIAQRAAGVDRDAAMLAGLIHDIGALPVLVWAEPIPSVISNPVSVRGIIEALHADLGAAILERWRYPDDLVAVPAEHENLSREATGAADLVDLVQIANILAARIEDRTLFEGDWWELPSARRLGLAEEDELGLLEHAQRSAVVLASALGED